MKDMQKLREAELYLIKKLSIIEMLDTWGFKPVRISGRRAYFLSPLRQEGTPSFVVYLKSDKEDWYDFGLGKGGSIIDLTMEFWNVDYPEAIGLLRQKITADRPADNEEREPF